MYLDKGKDPTERMKKANQLGEWIVILFVNVFPVACTLSVIVECLGSVIYSQWTLGYIDTDVLYYPSKFVYESASI